MQEIHYGVEEGAGLLNPREMSTVVDFKELRPFYPRVYMFGDNRRADSILPANDNESLCPNLTEKLLLVPRMRMIGLIVKLPSPR